jgi:UDP-glucose 4-epimerase
MSCILCTGGAGFIGSHIVDALISQNHQVIVIDNLSTGNPINVNPKAIFYKIDINSDLNWLFRVNTIDYVFHHAAQINLRHSITDPHFDANQNILGSLNVIHTAAKHHVKKLFFASTGGAIYDGMSPLPWREDTLAAPASPYGLAKLTIEKYLDLYNKLHNLEYVALRYSNVYGERQNSKGEAGVISIFIDKIKEGKDITIFGDGEQTRDFVCVHDVVSANLHALNNNLNGIFNVSTDTETSIKQIAEFLIQDKKIQITHLPAILGEIKNTRLSFAKLANTGWQPKYNLFSTLQLMMNAGI